MFFVIAAFRQRAWPLLVGLSSTKDESSTSASASIPPPLRDDDDEERYSKGGGSSSSRSVASVTTSSGRPPLHSTAALADSTNKILHPPSSGLLLPEEKKSDGYHDASIDLIRRDVNRSVVFRYNDNNNNNNNNNSSSSSRTTHEGQGNDKATPTYASERLAQALENTIRSTSTFHQPHRTNDGVTLPSMSQPQQQQESYHYYQGLHDVAGVVLHQLDYNVDLGTAILQRLAQSHWRDALRENFGNLTWIINYLFLPLVEKVDPNVHYQLQVTQVEMSNLILPWMITWLTHDIFQADTAGRLVDAFVSSHPMLPLYFSVALLTHPQFKNMILEADPNDPASLFVTMKQLPKFITSEIPSSKEFSGRFVLGQDLLDDALELM
jgi:Rab-GTPase-TBC domain